MQEPEHEVTVNVAVWLWLSPTFTTRGCGPAETCGRHSEIDLGYSHQTPRGAGELKRNKVFVLCGLIAKVGSFFRLRTGKALI
jgi:hypothetical protein